MTLTLDEVRDAIVARENPTLTTAEVELHAATVHRILELKQRHGVVILGHNYMEPLVYGLSEGAEQGTRWLWLARRWKPRLTSSFFAAFILWPRPPKS